MLAGGSLTMLGVVLRLLAVIRLSKHRGPDDPSTSPEKQLLDCEREAGVRNGRIVGKAEDLDVSAIKFNPFQRPQLRQWLAPERAHEFDGIIVQRFDRILRNMDDLHELGKWALTHRKIIIFANGPGGSPMAFDLRNGPADPLTKLTMSFLAFGAEMEAVAITQRNKSTQAYLRNAGMWTGGAYPYHLIPVRKKEGWKLVHNQETSDITRDIIDRVLDGESLMSVGEDLNLQEIRSPFEYRMHLEGKVPVAPFSGTVISVEDGMVEIRNPDGETATVRVYPKYAQLAVAPGVEVGEGDRVTLPILWNHITIGRMLRSQALIGVTEYEGKPVVGPDGMPVMRADPLIDRKTWDDLQRILGNKSLQAPKARNASQLVNIVFCGVCGEKMYIKRQTSYRRRFEYYGCRSAWGLVRGQLKANKCRARSVRAEVLEALIEDLVMRTIGDEECLEPVYIPASQHGEQLAEAKIALDNILKLAANKPDILQSVYSSHIAQLEERILRLSAIPSTPARTEMRPTGETYRQRWERSDRPDRARMLIESGIRAGVLKKEAPDDTARLPRLDLAGRDDELVWMGSTEEISVALAVPKDIIKRATYREGALDFKDVPLAVLSQDLSVPA